MYLAIVYDQDMPEQYTWPVLQARFFEMGHSMPEIKAMTLEEVGVVVGYMSGKAKGEEKNITRNRRLQGSGSAGSS